LAFTAAFLTAVPEPLTRLGVGWQKLAIQDLSPTSALLMTIGILALVLK
jgi:hypothetical protein